MMGGLSYMTGPGRPAAARRHARSTTSWAACSARSACWPRCASATRTGRGQEVQSALFENCVFLLGAAHAAVRDDRRAAAADAVARLAVERLRRLHAGGRRAALHRRGQRQAVHDAVRRARAPRSRRRPGASRPTRSASRCAPSCCSASARSCKHHRVDELSPKLEAAGIPYAPIVRPEQLLDDPHLKASGGLVPMQTDDGGTTDVVLLPLTMGGRRPGVRQALAARRRAYAGGARAPEGRVAA